MLVNVAISKQLFEKFGWQGPVRIKTVFPNLILNESMPLSFSGINSP